MSEDDYDPTYGEGPQEPRREVEPDHRLEDALAEIERLRAQIAPLELIAQKHINSCDPASSREAGDPS